MNMECGADDAAVVRLRESTTALTQATRVTPGVALYASRLVGLLWQGSLASEEHAVDTRSTECG